MAEARKGIEGLRGKIGERLDYKGIARRIFMVMEAFCIHYVYGRGYMDLHRG